MDGYYSLGFSNYCSDISGKLRCGLILNNYHNGDLGFSAEVTLGWRRNQMHPLKSGYLEEDLQIKTADIDIISFRDHVKVTSELLVSEDICLMYVDKLN